MNEFEQTPVKGEGEPVVYSHLPWGTPAPSKKTVDTVYIERRVPEFLEEAAHKIIDNFLADHGYDPKEI